MADPLTWPSVLVPSSEDWSLRGGTRSGGQTFQGNEQVVASPTARWKASLTIPCFGKDRIFAMRRLIALGRSQIWIVGPYEDPRAPWFIDPLTGVPISYRRGALDAGADAGYPNNADASSRLDFALKEAGLTNATAATIQRNRGGSLAPGMIFSLGNRLHMLTELTSPDPVDPVTRQAVAGALTVRFRPWFRTDYPLGTQIEFGQPRGLMRLASDDTGAMELQLSRYGTVSIELVEAF